MNLSDIPRDKRMHLVGGVAVAIALVALSWLATHVGWWAATAAGSVATGIGIELYQQVRNEGAPEWLDALASAAAGLVLAGVLWKIGL
jgi:inner membrane protein involved in colicin E2 resistance